MYRLACSQSNFAWVNSSIQHIKLLFLSPREFLKFSSNNSKPSNTGPLSLTCDRYYNPMAYSSFNLPTDIPNVPEELDWRVVLNHPENHFAHQFHPSMSAETSMLAGNHLLCNGIAQHPFTPQRPNFVMPHAPTHLNLHELDQHTVNFPVEDTGIMNCSAKESTSPIHNPISTPILVLVSSPTEYEPSQINTNTKRCPLIASKRTNQKRSEQSTIQAKSQAIPYHCCANDVIYFSEKSIDLSIATGKTANTAASSLEREC